ncbi:hypothetical protein, partial [Treponema endosymbiont of Eucomonympha sp.]|uniref:hypothetical protein n=1 Tax=Treponema endosymbiont of Eucomonympha sp. TaxID=1580831 RepID=UPI000B2412D8
ELTLVFDQPIAVLSADDITLTDDGGTGIQKGDLKAEGIYKLKVSGIMKGGDVTVTVSKAGYAFKGSPKKVTVYAPPTEPLVEVTFRSLTANGSATETTTALTLAFSKAVTELSADDITLEAPDGAGIQKGTLTPLDAAPRGTAVYTL